MDDTTKKRIKGYAHEWAEKFTAALCEALADPKPAPGTSDPTNWADNWRGWRLHFEKGYACVHGGRRHYHWRPGLSIVTFKPLSTDELTPSSEAWNALLTCYRRAVAKGLTTIPDGWEWLRDEMPSYFDPTEKVYMGLVGDGSRYAGWPCTVSNPEVVNGSNSRAAMLGLCDAKPDPCRRYGQCQHPAKTEEQPCCGCADHEPEYQDTRDELREANQQLAAAQAEVERSNEYLYRERVEVERLTRDLAAMTKSRDMWERAEKESAGEIKRLEVDIYHLSDPSRDPKVNRLIADLREVVVAQRDRLTRICETTARPAGGTKHAADNAIRHADEWLARTAPAPLDGEPG